MQTEKIKKKKKRKDVAALEMCHSDLPPKNSFLFNCQEDICYQPLSAAHLGSVTCLIQGPNLPGKPTANGWAWQGHEGLAVMPNVGPLSQALFTKSELGWPRLCLICRECEAVSTKSCFLSLYLSQMLPPANHMHSQPCLSICSRITELG